jgi:hypothetical protein
MRRPGNSVLLALLHDFQQRMLLYDEPVDPHPGWRPLQKAVAIHWDRPGGRVLRYDEHLERFRCRR